MKPYPHTYTNLPQAESELDDCPNAIGLGRAILGYLAFLATVGGAVALGLYLGSK